MIKLSPRASRILTALGVIALGVGLACVWRPNSASAQSSSASVIVPRAGLTFKTPEGRVLARLSSGSEGAVFELYDAQEHPSATIRGSSPGQERSFAAWPPVELETHEGLIDPWKAVTPGVVHRPVSGL